VAASVVLTGKHRDGSVPSQLSNVTASRVAPHANRRGAPDSYKMDMRPGEIDGNRRHELRPDLLKKKAIAL
jgi:hypothetical protein